MLRKQRQFHTQVHKLLDAALLGVGFWLSHALRAGLHDLGLVADPLQPFDQYSWMLAFIVPVTPLALELCGFYNRPPLAPRRATAWQLLKASSLVAAGCVIMDFLFRANHGRSVYMLLPLVSFVLVMAKEELIIRLIESRLGQPSLRQRLIVAGSTGETKKLKEYLEANIGDGVDVVEEVRLDDVFVGLLPELLHKYSANAVVLCAQHTVFGLVEKAIQTCELEGVEVWLMADFFKTDISQASLDEFFGRPMLVFRSAPEASWQALAKQIIDFVGALVLLIFGLIIMIPAALIIRITSPGPVLFRQQRAGINGRPFNMLKFRSMVNNAEQLKQELAQLNEMSGPVFKVTNDPRITPFGRFMRKWSIDELPQLFNVLRGDMSLVGPRPLPVDEVERFDDRAHRRRLSVKPGLTCLWQVSGRNNVRDFKDWVRLDLEYIDNWTIWLDLKILVRTVPVVLTGAGAR